MAHIHDGSPARGELNLGGVGEGECTAVSRDEHESQAKTRQILEGAFATNSKPSPWDLEHIAWQTNLSPEWVHLWFRERATGPCPLSERSESAAVASFLIPPGPNSVEEDVQFASGWVDNSAECYNNPVLFGNTPTIDLSLHQQHDFPHYSDDPSLSYRIEPNLSDYDQHLPDPESNSEPCNEPWHPGARYQSRNGQNVNDLSSCTSPPAIFLTEELLDGHVQETAKAASTSASLAPPTVSSEAIGSRWSRSRRLSVKSQDDIITCEHCGARFTGRYGRGNCSRHVRQQHSGRVTQLDSGCLCRVCKKQFNRQDARRKHEWKKHRLHDTRPLPRRQGANYDDTSSHAGTNDAVSDQGTLTCTHAAFEEAVVERRYRIPDLSHRAHDHFALANNELDGDAYDSFCEQFLAWCKYIVGELRVKESDAHHGFARAVRHLALQLCTNTLDSARLSLNDSARQANDAEHDEGRSDHQHPNSRQDKGKASARSRAPGALLRSHPYTRQCNMGHSSDPLLIVAEQFEKPACLDLDCPVYKWYLVHRYSGRIPPCNGCMEKHMNGVRQHLLPSYSQQHTRHVQYIKRCSSCTEDVIDEVAWTSEGHKDRRCESRTQPRGMGLINWARLYLKIFPDEKRVPSPFRHDSRFLPDELVSRIQAQIRSKLPMVSPSPTRPASPYAGDDQLAGLDGARARNAGARHRWLDNDLEATTSLDVLLLRLPKLLQELKAAKVAGTSQAHGFRDSDSADHAEAEYRVHLHEIRHQDLKDDIAEVPNYAPDASSQSLSFAPGLSQGQATAIGSADFQLPQTNTHANATHVACSDIDTLPSTQDNYHGDASFGFLSGFGSSQTSYDFGSLVLQDKGNEAPGFLQAAPSPLNYPSSFLTPAGQWAAPYDPRLDQAGPSDLPQTISAQYDRALLEADINQMFETSPLESPTQYRASNLHEPEDAQSEPTPDWA